MRTRVQKWGNSLAIRIPKAFAADARIERDTLVDLALEDSRLVVTPVRTHELTLEQLLTGITEENLHREIETGPAIGREIW